MFFRERLLCRPAAGGKFMREVDQYMQDVLGIIPIIEAWSSGPSPAVE